MVRNRRQSSLFGAEGAVDLQRKSKKPSHQEPEQEVKRIVRRFSRITFSFRRESNLRPILKKHDGKARRRLSRAAKKRVRRVRIDETKAMVLDITPLVDKPLGRVRMPSDSFSGDDEESSQGSSAPSRLSDYTGSVINDAGSSKFGDQSMLQPVALNFDVSLESYRVRRTSTSLKWSQSETEITAQAAVRKPRRKEELWSQLVAPQTPDDFFANARPAKALVSWFTGWEKRLKDSQNSAPPASTPGNNVNVGGRGRKNRGRVEEPKPCEYAPPQPQEEPMLPNPLILFGPTGSGKSAAISYAASNVNASIISLSFASNLDEKELSESVSKVLQVQKATTKTQARYNLRSCARTVPPPKFAVLVVEDCDVISQTTDGDAFWTRLKDICAKMKLPVILTCSDYPQVRKLVLADPPLSTYRSMLFVRPAPGRLAHYLRAWLYGFTGEVISTKWLAQLIRQHKCDVSAVLNKLQLLLTKSNSGNYEVSKPASGSEFYPLGSHLTVISAMAEVDAAFGRAPISSISWRASRSTQVAVDDLPFAHTPLLPYSAREQEEYGIFGQVADRLDDYVKHPQFSSLPSLREPSQPEKTMKTAVKDACFRSLPKKLYPVKEVALDYLPTLSAKDKAFSEHQLERLRRGDSEQEVEAAEHPFDETDPTGAAIDLSSRLKISIGDYTYSGRYQPT